MPIIRVRLTRDSTVAARHRPDAVSADATEALDTWVFGGQGRTYAKTSSQPDVVDAFLTWLQSDGSAETDLVDCCRMFYVHRF